MHEPTELQDKNGTTAEQWHRLADAFQRSAEWLDKGLLAGPNRTHPLVGTADYKLAADGLRMLAASTQGEAQTAAPVLHAANHEGGMSIPRRGEVDAALAAFADSMTALGMANLSTALLVKLPDGSVESFSTCRGALNADAATKNICRPGKELLGIRDCPLHAAQPSTVGASPEVQARDAARLDWMERQHVEVRTPLRNGSRPNFHASPELEEERSDLRARVDRAMTPTQPPTEEKR